MAKRTGPFEEGRWPQRLRAVAVSPPPHPRLHGYDIARDLSRHYSLAEVMVLAVTGELPDEASGRALEIALIIASTCPINEAPTHGAALARVMGAPVGNALATGFLIGCEASRATVEDHRELLQWLRDGREGPPPPCARANEDHEADVVEELRRALAPLGPSLAPPKGTSRTAALLSVMWACGLRCEDALIAALSWAKTLSIAAESVGNPRGELSNLPNRVPDFQYEAPGS
ncbi:citrate synthase family protein [Paraliomyxa miuraensis]|uniref:hypothetical protein n=1 Tax=Paraliomyxa miuraensis TaxID=376150 RepID=UPI002257284B|nr:hypothetical protein [Paraliomyxa miuraensis]MCX4243022.1 hypothetical protein [Paraliomyxa miuraensis]